MPASAFTKAAIAEDALHEASRFTSAVTDAVKDRLRVANHQIRRGRYALEDVFAEVVHAIKRRPIAAVAVAYAAGLVTATVVTCATMSRRH